MPTTSLGAFLVRMRERRVPDASTRTPGRRRVKGLRREEVAIAAGISPTWYTWIEQGRQVTCSRATLERIAAALDMNTTERAHLFDLADADIEAPPPLATQAPAQLAALVDAMPLYPAYVINALWDVLHANEIARALFGPFEPCNVLCRLFQDDGWRAGFEDWEAIAQSAVAQFRAATGRWQHGAAFQARVGGLADVSSAFATFWERKRLAAPPLKQKVFCHPRAGRIVLHYATMRPDGVDDDVSIVLYVPTAESLEAVRSLVPRPRAKRAR